MTTENDTTRSPYRCDSPLGRCPSVYMSRRSRVRSFSTPSHNNKSVSILHDFPLRRVSKYRERTRLESEVRADTPVTGTPAASCCGFRSEAHMSYITESFTRPVLRRAQVLSPLISYETDSGLRVLMSGLTNVTVSKVFVF